MIDNLEMIQNNLLLLKDEAIFPGNKKWENSISRDKSYPDKKDIRSHFEKDYNKIIFTDGFKRLKHKTQVFFNPENDHISTRSEHVLIVESIAYTIAKYLGLNLELTRAISIAHDIGHAPFGHAGERILSNISKKYLDKTFWHEKNGLEVLDDILLLKDEQNKYKNLNLTYALRDGVISHCGEIDQNCLKPRDEFFNLSNYKYPNEFNPYTFEGCVVKVADKIAYLGRDIEDAISIGILDEYLDELYEILNLEQGRDVINNSSLIRNFILDICANSNKQDGLKFSDEMFDMINKIKKFNYEKIYFSNKITKSKTYFETIINTLFETLLDTYDGIKTINNLEKYKDMYLIKSFKEYISQYFIELKDNENFKNKSLFSLKNKKDYIKAIIYYISGMTDNFAIKTYNEAIGFEL